jgi:hypothetical protein
MLAAETGAIAHPAPAQPLNLPVCYLQIQGGGVLDVSRLCGKRLIPTADPSRAPLVTPVGSPTRSSPPPPDFSGRATAGKCVVLDANGKPCPKEEPEQPAEVAKPGTNPNATPPPPNPAATPLRINPGGDVPGTVNGTPVNININPETIQLNRLDSAGGGGSC